MNLKVQIISIFFSFLFGIVCIIFYKKALKYLLNKKIESKIIYNFFYFISCSLLFFLILRQINYGVLHTYFLLFLIFGGFIGLKIVK